MAHDTQRNGDRKHVDSTGSTGSPRSPSSTDPRQLVKSLDNFKVLKKLSEGRSSKVVLAETVADRRRYAIKIIKQHDKPTISYQSYNSMQRIQNEITIMKQLRSHDHPHILKLFNVIVTSREISHSYSQNKVYMVLEYCARGELSFKKLKDIGATFRTFRAVLSAVEFLHLNGIVHRDIKPSNILVGEDGEVKLSDFGISYRLTGDDTVDQFRLGSTMGTPLFMAPELCAFKDASAQPRNKPRLDTKIDVWSLGVTFYWLVFEHLPFFSDNEFKLFNKIVNDPLEFGPMTCCPIFNRYTSDEAYGHGEKIIIFTKLCDLLDKMMHKNPARRCSVAAAKKSGFITYDMAEKDRRAYIRSNDAYIQPGRDASMGSLESALSRLLKRRKSSDQLRPGQGQGQGQDVAADIWDRPDDWNASANPTPPDVPLFRRQPADDVVSDLEDSSVPTSSDDSDFVNNHSSTHQLFGAADAASADASQSTKLPDMAAPDVAPPRLNNSCFSLPLDDNRASDNTMLTVDSRHDVAQLAKPPRPAAANGNSSAPITPLSPTYSSSELIQPSAAYLDNVPKLQDVPKSRGLTRSKGAYSLSKMTASKGATDLHALLRADQ